MTNRERAKAARLALAAFTMDVFGRRTPEELGAPSVDEGIGGATVTEETDAETMVYDLIAGLHHYCDAVGLDWDGQIARAEYHYDEEKFVGSWDEDC